MPRAHPREFREDVVAAAFKGDAPIAEIAKDFGVSESCLRNWLRVADVADGHRRQAAGPPAHDDLVERQFTAIRANRLWLTYITEHRTDQGKLYLCAIKDL